MKKIVLLASAFIFSFAVMAQTQAKPKPQKPVNKLQTRPDTKIQPVVKTTTSGDAKTQSVNPTTVQPGPSPDEVMKVNTEKYDFGKIKQGVPVNYSFELKNISNKPLVVENTSASCGCTTPEKITEPIAPGATVKLKVQYSAAGIGNFTKDVHIKLAGIAQDKTVQITGEVLAPEPPKEVKANN